MTPESVQEGRRRAPSELATDLGALLSSVDAQPSAVAYMRAAREIEAFATAHLEPTRVALLSSFTIDPLLPYLKVEAARQGFGLVPFVGPFNSVMQELVNPASGTAAHAPDVVFVTQLLEDVAPRLATEFLSLGPAAVAAETNRVIDDLGAALVTFRRHSPATVVVHNFTPPVHRALGLIDGVTPQSQSAAIRQLNTELATLARGAAGVFVLDYDGVVAETGARAWWDDKMWALGRAPLSAAALPALARRHAAYIRAVKRSPRKALVVDLDDTLWGGVVGEVGAAGIKLGADYPGNVYRDLQRALRQLKQRGVLLAINSKNNLEDVREVFRTNPGMILSLDDFSAVRATWDPKPVNMRAIAAELNIGLDSLVFLDDNPAERALMRQALPEVLTIDLPATPLRYAAVLADSGAFDRLTVTGEDRTRTEMYQAQRERRELEHSGLSLEDFLTSLDMRVAIEPANEASLPRVVDLLQKTNQFNLTTRRHSAADVHRFMTDPACGVWTIRVVDRFGDNGLVGLAIACEQDDAAKIDTLLLSCRVIGRQVETGLLWQVAQWAQARALTVIDGEFLATAKNAPAADFFPRHRFEPLASSAAGSTWRLRLDQTPVEWPACLAFLR